MKRIILLNIFSLLTTFCVAQSDKKISVEYNNRMLSEVIKEISSFYNVKFAYSSDKIDLSQKVSVKLTNADLQTALNLIFRNTSILFSVDGQIVSLHKNDVHFYTVSGYVKEAGSGELLIGAIINTEPLVAGCISNSYGFYSITLPEGSYLFRVNYFGFRAYEFKIDLTSPVSRDIFLESKLTLDEVIVFASSDKEIHTDQIDVHLKEINTIPSILGEKDVLKYVSLMPGVQKGNEGSNYLFVRGGAADQNLIMVDDAVIYNAYHFLGLSTVFTGSELKNASLVKGGFSAKYGGRISSVLNMSMKDGNKETFGLEATAGLISSRFMVEGPIQKSKSSYLISLRHSYLNEVSKIVAEKKENEINYRYTDFHAKVSTDVFKNSKLFVSAYLGQDQLITAVDPKLVELEEGVKWSNKAIVTRWNQLYGKKVFSNTSFIYSSYSNKFSFGDSSAGITSLTKSEFSISDYSVKHDFDIVPNMKHFIRIGGSFTYRTIGSLVGILSESTAGSTFNGTSTDNNMFESSVYAEDEYKPNSFLSITPGIRYTNFKSSKVFNSIEPRIKLKISLKKNWEIAMSYSQMTQFMQMISPMGGLGLPIERWTSAGNNIKPQDGTILTLGVCKNDIKNSRVSILVEGYYKTVDNISGLKEGTSLLQILPLTGNMISTNWDFMVTQGKCNSYGGEIMLKQNLNKLTWWVSYTLSKTQLLFEEMNRGEAFPATYDRTHDFGAFIHIKLSKHLSASCNWIYGTGNAISLPVGEYYSVIPSVTGTGNIFMTSMDYENKNSYRMKAYSKMDLSIIYSHLIGKKIQSTIEFSVYNLLNRSNAFYYQITNEDPNVGNSKRVLKQISLFPIMPSLSWSIKI